MGYFCVDSRDSRPEALVFNRAVPLRDTWAKIAQKVAAKPEPAGKPAAPPQPVPLAENVVSIPIEDFARLRLATAKVIQAEPVPGADRLLRLQIDLGSEKRQIVAGIAAAYHPGDVVGRTIVVVTNLRPAVIRGVESNGMLLAAKAKGTLRLVTVDGDIPPGASVS
ncbi:MAG: methionine--tRNA ligase subunit beta [Lentisphaeria bacterium]|nr:methionine--tRNA ligase subunit beta [Lentisphaeria bacterium]